MRSDPAPLDGPFDDGLSRRSFLQRTCLLGVSLAVGAPLAATLAACDSAGPSSLPAGVTVSGNTLTIDLTQPGVSALGAPGGFLYVSAADTVVVNVDGTVIRAFSSLCPHEGRPVSQHTGGALVCPSHDSRFDPATGAPLSGPARSGLRAYAVSRSGDTLTVTMA